MKIKRSVNGEEMEFELTAKELNMAHAEHERILNLEDVLEYLNECEPETILDMLDLKAKDFSEAGMNDLINDIKKNEDLMMEIHYRYRSVQMDGFGPESECMAEACMDIFRWYKEQNPNFHEVYK